MFICQSRDQFPLVQHGFVQHKVGQNCCLPWNRLFMEQNKIFGPKRLSTPWMAYNCKSWEPSKTTGRPRKNTGRGERHLVWRLEKNPSVSPKRLQVPMNRFSPDNAVCEETMRRILRRRAHSTRAIPKNNQWGQKTGINELNNAGVTWTELTSSGDVFYSPTWW